MEKVLVVSLLVLASLRSASTEMFIKEGGNVTLDLRPAPSDPITIIQWKFKDSILAEWIKDVVDLTHNRLNIKLDKVSGSLAMEKMTKAEEGVYSVEVNSNVQKVTYNVLVIKDVPKPKIEFFPLICSDERDKCSMTCDGNTTGAEPVTYSWKTGDGEWKESGKDMPITREEHGQEKTFTCKMKNPVSEKESAQVQNKLYKKEEELPGSSTGAIVGVIFGFLLVVIVVVLVVVAWKKKIISCVKDPENGNPHIKDGPAGETEHLNKSHEEKADVKDGPAGQAQPRNTPPDDKPVIKEGEADTNM